MYEILVRLHNGESWKDALSNSIPKRKIAALKADDAQPEQTKDGQVEHVEGAKPDEEHEVIAEVARDN